MTGFSAAVLGFCVFAIMSALLISVLPKKCGTSAALKILTGLIGVILLFSMFTDISSDGFELNSYSGTDYSSTVSEYVSEKLMKTAKAEVESAVTENLKKHSIDKAEVSADMDISDNGSISISKVYVTIHGQADANKIESELGDAFNAKCSVTIKDDTAEENS